MGHHRSLAAVTILFLLLAIPIPGQVVADDSPPVVTVETLSQQAGSQVQVAFHVETGKVRFIGTDPEHPFLQPDPLPDGATAETAARQFLATYGSLFGLKDPAEELQMMEEQEADRGRSFVRFQQVSGGIPVLGGELVVQLNPEQDVLSVNGEVLPEISVSRTPVISPETAASVGLSAVAKDSGQAAETLRATKPELWYFNPKLLGGPGLQITSLVWRMEVQAAELTPVKDLVLVDAQRGVVVLQFSEIDAALYRKIYDNANNRYAGLPGTGPVRVEGQGPTGVNDVNLAYDYAGDVYNFYLNTHGRDSLDGHGMQLISTVRYCDPDPTTACPYDNAFWNGAQMVYGEGYSAADDVVGHEMTHAVTDHTSLLFYYMQSGAINESFSDIWGEFIDLTNGKGDDSPAMRWLMGEDLPDGAIRSMSNPPAYNDPDRIGSSNYWCDARDNGGVHINSGVSNKAAYLITDGGTFNGQTVAGLGIAKAAKIYYEVQTHLFTSASDFQDLYNTLQQACTNLVGTSGITAGDCQQVKKAVDAVEINRQPSGCAANEAPICPAGQVPTNLFFDDLETPTSGRWTKNALSGTNVWYYPQNPNPYQGWDPTYATSGATNMWGDDADTVSDAVIRMTAGVTIPSGKPVYMRFNHAFAFDGTSSTFYDGGVVEYTPDGSTWQDAGALFTDNGYRGTISGSFGNPLGGRQGFGGRSWGYLSSRLGLNSLAGQNVRFRFRIASDNSDGAQGWWIDDVRIYTCDALVQGPDMSIVKRVVGSNFRPGEPIAYTLTIANIGTASASGIIIADIVPPEITTVSYSSTLPVIKASGANYTWDLASLAAGASGTITINGKLSASLPQDFKVVNTATVSAPDDNNPANNSSSVTVPGNKIYMPLVMLRWPPIPEVPVLNPISNPDGGGSYNVTWNPADRAATYTLRESFNDANFSSAATVYNGAGTSWPASGKAPGTYYYQVRAANGWGSSSWSNVQSVVVQPPIPEIPVLNPISNPDGDGSYDVTWNPANRATAYLLRESFNDPNFGNPATVYSGAGTAWSASGRPLGTYYYSVQATNAWGPGGWSNVQSVVVAPPALPTRFGSIADAAVISSVPGFPGGSYNDMLAGYDHCSGGANGIWRSLVRFDLSAVPHGTAITNARLYVYLIESCDLGSRTHTVKTSRITGDWSEYGVAWNNQPGTGTEYGSAAITSGNWGWYSFDVTQLVRGWLNGTFPNYGVMLRGPEASDNSSASLGFPTREYGGDEVPYLSITYAGLAASEPASASVTASQPFVCGNSVARRLWSQGFSLQGFRATQACADH